jgi:hypothetical protein
MISNLFLFIYIYKRMHEIKLYALYKLLGLNLLKKPIAIELLTKLLSLVRKKPEASLPCSKEALSKNVF